MRVCRAHKQQVRMWRANNKCVCGGQITNTFVAGKAAVVQQAGTGARVSKSFAWWCCALLLCSRRARARVSKFFAWWCCTLLLCSRRARGHERATCCVGSDMIFSNSKFDQYFFCNKNYVSERMSSDRNSDMVQY